MQRYYAESNSLLFYVIKRLKKLKTHLLKFWKVGFNKKKTINKCKKALHVCLLKKALTN